MSRLCAAVFALFLFAAPAAADAPMNYLATQGTMALRIEPLLWGLLGLSIAVIIIISCLVLVGALRRGRAGALATIPLSDGPQTRWIAIGVVVTTVILLGLVTWNSVVMARIANPPSEPALTIELRGHQWWWEATYQNKDPSQIFATANEIHIPVGQPVRIALTSADVIHTFWVPALAGKTQLIPGQTNLTWIEADRPGVYRGQCSQYCGEQHAHMAFTVHADPAPEFERWRKAEIGGAEAPQTAELQVDQQRFVQRCGVCHRVRGTRAGGAFGPDLTHLMSRDSLAADTLPNNDGYRAAWIADPQHVKPGAYMPNPELTGPDLAAVVAFVKTLK
jgi:cytochrome c oxidase subunit 2